MLVARQEHETKRHRWVDDKCIHCDLRRSKEPARSQRGCYGYHHFERTVYRTGAGREVWVAKGRVPPCRPPRRLIP